MLTCQPVTHHIRLTHWPKCSLHIHDPMYRPVMHESMCPPVTHHIRSAHLPKCSLHIHDSIWRPITYPRRSAHWLNNSLYIHNWICRFVIRHIRLTHWLKCSLHIHDSICWPVDLAVTHYIRSTHWSKCSLHTNSSIYQPANVSPSRKRWNIARWLCCLPTKYVVLLLTQQGRHITRCVAFPSMTQHVDLLTC